MAGYVLGAVFELPHDIPMRDGCLGDAMGTNPSMRRQALVCAMGHRQGDAGDCSTLHPLSRPPRSLPVGARPEHFDRIAEQAMRTPGSAQPGEKSSIASRRCARSGSAASSVGGPMYTGKHAHRRPLQPAFIHGPRRRGRDLRENGSAQPRWRICFAKRGLKEARHDAVFMENNSRALKIFPGEACGDGGGGPGCIYTCVNVPDRRAARLQSEQASRGS